VNVGFYGTSKGMTEKQRETIKQYIKQIKITEFRHTDNLGSVDLHEYLLQNNLAEKIVLYPPNNMEIRGFCAALSNVEIKEENYLSKNLKLLCKDLDLLIIAPGENDTEKSGAYASLEIGKKNNVKKIIIVKYNSSIEQWPTKDITKIKGRIKNNGKAKHKKTS